MGYCYNNLLCSYMVTFGCMLSVLVTFLFHNCCTYIVFALLHVLKYTNIHTHKNKPNVISSYCWMLTL